MKTRLIIISMMSVFCLPSAAFAASLSVYPEKPIQGEPLLITVQGVTYLSDVLGVSLGSSPLRVFQHQSRPVALYGIDLNHKVGTSTISARLKDGTVLEKDLFIGKREKDEAPLGIPPKLGGNSTTSQKTLVNTLALENLTFLGLRTGTHAFWTEKFGYPVANPVITDDYGYSRKTGAYTISHKGTDFRAKEGTPILAMNRGVVRIAREYRNYGNTVVVDHGLGLMTFYMHLSKIFVNVGELVKPGQVMGLSGQTGYAISPHLHLTVRINDVSIDPAKFLELFKRGM